jgi:hypothetical protein
VDDLLVDALGRTSPEHSAALNVARQQFRNLRAIQNSIERGADRFISPLRLSSGLTTKANQNLSVFGLGGELNQELANLARAGRQILPDIVGNSGTAARQQLPTASLGRAALDGTVAAGTLGLPFALQRGLLSQGALGRGLSEGVPGIVGAAIKQTPSSFGRTIQSQIFEGEEVDPVAAVLGL